MKPNIRPLKKGQTSLLTKLISLLLGLFLFINNSLFAYAIDTSFWKDRQKTMKNGECRVQNNSSFYTQHSEFKVAGLPHPILNQFPAPPFRSMDLSRNNNFK